MPTYKLVLEYVGTRFAGWQIQPSAPTVQGELVDRLRRLFNDPELQVAGAARTDAGTHAHGQVASFTSSKIWDPGRLRHALNRMLPESGLTKPVIRLTRVVFPAPLGPMMPRTSPLNRVNPTSNTA